ncbi:MULTISPECIES: hypothetical protein [Rhodobacterales]|jgi:hypothetical protein|uniref:Uncharacterized protein n=2 Tax=Celeribacter TaxID=875170 RepID=A0A1I3XP57_9RHOB|nr:MULTISPECIES: hypothetical protein [Rhodobacterales]PTQ67139.1 hypothetical protein C8N42_12010 [Celeribacter persicus]SFK21263.1 hypothetical protein SAMN04487991_4137 [Celeribacter neptunius]SFN78897.1 hypothetical protein SAMN05216224_1142 [Thioclava dalianensis]|tara:strand:- start:2259 stop:2429 length:171 start_codon:yes stop_codon:yes gene_type:complete
MADALDGIRVTATNMEAIWSIPKTARILYIIFEAVLLKQNVGKSPKRVGKFFIHSS